jgi:hypothetical protein
MSLSGSEWFSGSLNISISCYEVIPLERRSTSALQVFAESDLGKLITALWQQSSSSENRGEVDAPPFEDILLCLV